MTEVKAFDQMTPEEVGEHLREDCERVVMEKPNPNEVVELRMKAKTWGMVLASAESEGVSPGVWIQRLIEARFAGR